MSEIEICVKHTMPSYRCVNCGTEFAIVNIVRPSGEEDDVLPWISYWGNPEHKPYCPHCGDKSGVTR